MSRPSKTAVKASRTSKGVVILVSAEQEDGWKKGMSVTISIPDAQVLLSELTTILGPHA